MEGWVRRKGLCEACACVHACVCTRLSERETESVWCVCVGCACVVFALVLAPALWCAACEWVRVLRAHYCGSVGRMACILDAPLPRHRPELSLTDAMQARPTTTPTTTPTLSPTPTTTTTPPPHSPHPPPPHAQLPPSSPPSPPPPPPHPPLASPLPCPPPCSCLVFPSAPPPLALWRAPPAQRASACASSSTRSRHKHA
eukprot:2382259-Rhodomonas_salina.1